MNSVVIHYMSEATIYHGSLFASGSGVSLASGFKAGGTDYNIADLGPIVTTGTPRFIYFNEDGQPLLVSVNSACSITEGHKIIDFMNAVNNNANIVCNSPARLGIGVQ